MGALVDFYQSPSCEFGTVGHGASSTLFSADQYSDFKSVGAGHTAAHKSVVHSDWWVC